MLPVPWEPQIPLLLAWASTPLRRDRLGGAWYLLMCEARHHKSLHEREVIEYYIPDNSSMR